MHVHKEKPRKDTSGDPSIEKPIKVPEGIATAIEAERAGPRRKVDFEELDMTF